MSSKTRYNALQIIFHWLTALLFLGNYIVSEEMGRALHKHIDDPGVALDFTTQFHVYVGIAFLTTVVLRLVVRVVAGAPEQINSGHPLMDKAAKVVHWLIYALMILTPALGIVAWYGNLAEFGDIHVAVMNLLLALTILHFFAAVYHHFILKDNLLFRMSFRDPE